MASNSEIVARESRFDSGAYGMKNIALVRGKGELVWDADGKEYIDCISSHGSANLGHSHPKVVEAVRRQAEVLMSCPKTFYNDRSAEFKEALISVAPKGMEGMFLCNSGTEAVEGGVKLAKAATGRKNIVAFIGAFHGRTLGALALTWNKKYREPFEPLMPGVRHIRYGDADALAAAVDGNTAAVVMEPIQGENGVKIPPVGYLKRAREICDAKGAMLVLDEIQTGFGRTGLMFECMREGVVPDVMCLAKSVAAGLPMGVVLARQGVHFKPKEHGNTFGDNPLICAAGAAAIGALVQEKLVERSASEGARFMQRLAALKGHGKVVDVRGRGMMIAIEVADAPGRYVSACIEKGLLVFPAGETVIRVYPPLVASRESLDKA
ncbi:MAG: aspartate aminotransferase family protein, partial [Candidatus Micrarchaeia archaeon]